MAALLGRFSAICKALSQGTTRLANNSNVLPSITPTRNWPTLAHHQIRHKCEGPINKCQDFERCKGKKGEIVLKCYGKPKAPCKGPKRQNFEPALKPVKSVWETTPNFECFNHEFPKRLPECMPECNAELTRFDCLFYRPTNDRKYTQTWSECPELKPMECPCIYDHVKVDYVKRAKKCKVEKRDCCLDANKKCVVIGAPCCKKGRIPPKCKKQRTPKKCRKLCCPFPAYSECCQKKPARIPGRPPECFCLRPLPMCVVYRTLERMEAAKSKGRAKKSKEDRKAKKNKDEKKPERYPKC